MPIVQPVLRISETFYSLQGESSLVGLPTFFIRLTGCPLRCGYCDTEYAFQGGELFSVDSLVAMAEKSDAVAVCVTGGEPLAQPECLILLEKLCDAGLRVSLETSGAMPIESVDKRVVKIVDIKTPGSGEKDKNRWQNIVALQQTDQIKFVICDRQDYDWAKSKIIELDLATKVNELLFSPSAGELGPRELAAWLLKDKLPVRFQLQMHKILWSDRRGV